MADFAIASDDSQKVVGTLAPDQPLSGPVNVVKDAGPSDFTQDASKPLEIQYVSGSVAGVTVYTVTGTDAAGRSVSDVVTYTVSAVPPPPPPPLTTLGQTFAAAQPKV